MALTDLYNQASGGLKKLAKPISTYFQPPMAKAAPAPVPTTYQIKDRGVQITDEDLNAVRPLLYGEVSNRTPDKQALEAHVILNTALNRIKGYSEKGQKKTLTDVIAMPNQYQAYGGKQYQVYNNPPDAVAAAKKKQIDMIVDNIRQQIQSGDYPDITEGAYYYVHDPKTGKITYDNTRPLFAK